MFHFLSFSLGLVKTSKAIGDHKLLFSWNLC
jgi:hypothetical protein